MRDVPSNLRTASALITQAMMQCASADRVGEAMVLADLGTELDNVIARLRKAAR